MRGCVAQGVPVKVTDTRVIEKVRTLLSGKPGRGASPAGSTGDRSEAPSNVDPLGVEVSRTRLSGVDDDVTHDCIDDGALPGEVER